RPDRGGAAAGVAGDLVPLGDRAVVDADQVAGGQVGRRVAARLGGVGHRVTGQVDEAGYGRVGGRAAARRRGGSDGRGGAGAKGVLERRDARRGPVRPRDVAVGVAALELDRVTRRAGGGVGDVEAEELAGAVRGVVVV